MATGTPLETDLIYLERDLVQYRISWYDFTNRVGVEENDLVFVQRELQYFSVRVGDIWSGDVMLEDTDFFLVERGIRGAFNPDDPEDPAYFGRLYHANPEIGVYIEFELISDTGGVPEVTITVGGDAWSNNLRPRIVTPSSGSHMITPQSKTFTFQGAGIYGIMGYLKGLSISSPDTIDASLSTTSLWHDMNSRDRQFGANLFSDINRLTGVPEALYIKNAWQFAANTNFDFGGSNPLDNLKIRYDETTNRQAANAARAFFNTTNLPGLYNATISQLWTSAEMFAESDFSGPFWTGGTDHISPPSWRSINSHKMFFNCVNYTGSDQFWQKACMGAFTPVQGDTARIIEDASKMFEGSAFNANFSNWGTSWIIRSCNNMHRMFARSNFNGVISGTTVWDINHYEVEDVSEMFADNPTFARNVLLNFGNVSQLTPVNVEGMFRNTRAFDRNFNGEWKFNRVKDGSVANMFRDATGLTTPTAPANWDVSPLRNYSNMFTGSTFNVDLKNWDTQNATNMDHMFDNAAVFNFDLTGWCVPLIPDEPVNFADTTVFPEIKHPQWGTCPVPVVVMPKLQDYTDRDFVNGDVGHALRYDEGELEIPAEKLITVWEIKKQGETDFKELDGWLLYNSQYSGTIAPALENSVIRAKETHQNVKYDDDIVLYSNELAIGPAPARTFWTFDYTGDPGKILRVNISYAQMEAFDGANWDFVTFDEKVDFTESYSVRRTNSLRPGKYRFDTTYDKNWDYVSSSDNFGSTDLIVDNTSTLGAVTNMNEMFAMTGYKGQDFSWLDTSKVAKMYKTFYRTKSTQLDVSNWDLSNVTTFDKAFAQADGFTGTGLETWGLAPKAAEAKEMFWGCKNLNVSMSNMQLPKVKNAQAMFERCENAEFDPPGEMFTGQASNASNMFRNCYKFNGNIGGFRMGFLHYASNMFNNCRAFNPDSFQNADWTGQKMSSHGAQNMFTNCRQFNQSLAVLPRGFFKKVAFLDYTFEDCVNFAGEGMGGLIFENATSFRGTFKNSGLEGDVDVSGWVLKTDGDIRMVDTFSSCKKAESFVGLPQWDTSRVTNMNGMLKTCYLLHQDDMYELDVANVVDVNDMFRSSNMFNADLSSWCVPKLGPADRRQNFAKYSGIADQPAKHPVWGQCPPRVVSQPIIV